MSETAFTSGPWFIECGVTQRTGWAIKAFRADHRYETVLWLDGGKNLTLDQETGRVEANQNLLVAAPELLKALIDLVGDLEPPPHQQFITRAISADQLVAAKDAIKRALEGD